MFKKLILVPLAAIVTLSGCAPTGSSTFRQMSSAYREVLEEYANDNVLLNIIRSSKNMPVSFLDMPSVIGTGNVGVNAGLNTSIFSNAPGSVTGFFSAEPIAGASSFAPSVGLSVNSGFNFTQSSLDNSQFMSSFLSDIRPEVVASLTNNQVGPKSILYSLVIDTIELRDKNNVIISKYFNNPYLPNYEEFQKALYTLIEAGLSTEIVMEKQVVSAPMSAEALNRNLVAAVAAQAQPGTMVVPVKTGGVTNYQIVRMMPTTRMCLNKQSEQLVLGQTFAESAFCNSDAVGILPKQALLPETAASLRKAGVGKDSRLVIKLRSTRNVFDFLGTLVKLQNGDPPRQIKVMNSDAIALNPNLINDTSSAIPLFIVEKGRGVGKAMASVSYQGETYYVPAESNSYTREVLTLLSQLLTLNKVPGSIPPSPAVLIK
ncbi:hypothetical protein [Zwartia vadi]|uniref:hypothetical protein n=1 Tax=Zwartia vadi TaxID=3058168 RepID=UPI0025B2A04C|nr:hypothetical protein [Zwartia vadi]MDN3988593.1 hypothetical protein [Zwartia vadi]